MNFYLYIIRDMVEFVKKNYNDINEKTTMKLFNLMGNFITLLQFFTFYVKIYTNIRKILSKEVAL